MITNEQRLEQLIQQDPAGWERIQRTLDAVYATIPDANRAAWDALHQVRGDPALMLTTIAMSEGVDSDTYRAALLAVVGTIEGLAEVARAKRRAREARRSDHRREYNRAYREQNREKIAAYQREWRRVKQAAKKTGNEPGIDRAARLVADAPPIPDQSPNRYP